jgi:hypothetical protein
MRVLSILLAVAAAGCPEPVLRAQQTPNATREQYSLRFAPGGERSLEVDTVWGSIDVTTHEGDTVDVVVDRTVRARTDEGREAAERDVQLAVTDHAAALRLYVDGPFRRRDRDWEWDRRGRPDYEVRYDFKVRVPRRVAVRLRTVNHGDISVRGIEGRFEVRNVNGRIDLLEVAGSGTARTVNGDVRAEFRGSPQDAVQLVTLNGDVVARFGSALSADVWIKTAHGDAYTDYDYAILPARQPEMEQRGSKRIWRISSKTGIRIGGGGPSLDMESFNGDIRILRSES